MVQLRVSGQLSSKGVNARGINSRGVNSRGVNSLGEAKRRRCRTEWGVGAEDVAVARMKRENFVFLSGLTITRRASRQRCASCHAEEVQPRVREGGCALVTSDDEGERRRGRAASGDTTREVLRHAGRTTFSGEMPAAETCQPRRKDSDCFPSAWKGRYQGRFQNGKRSGTGAC